jgi:hypothetical protein
MSNSSQFDFTKFVPGFDFLKQLSQSNASMPQAHHWIAPSVDPKEIEKRIQELKTVHFWLEQNTKAVLATVQALEVQLMTINTLKGMNMSMTEMAKGLQIKPQEEKKEYFPQTPKTPSAASVANEKTNSETMAQKDSHIQEATQAVDPMAWWGSLSEQFSHIANQTFAEIQKTSAEVTRIQAEKNKSKKASSKLEETPSPSSPKGVKPIKLRPFKRATVKTVKKEAAVSRGSKTTAKTAQKKALSKALNKAPKSDKDVPSNAPVSWFSSPPPLTRSGSKTKKRA